MSYLRSLVVGFLLCTSLAMASVAPALAQAELPKDLPVLNPVTDANGVDMTSGSYTTSSSFSFRAPGAGHLDVATMFNGRRLSFNLNIYVEDQTYSPYDWGPNERHIRVHLGGTDKLFTCDGSGTCVQNGKLDATRLTRVATDKYQLTDRDGVIYTFFDPAYQPLSGCEDFESGCNDAEYAAYSYASTITYPTGEKLTYSSSPTVTGSSGAYTVTHSVTSNLGYRLDLVFTTSTFNTPALAGASWLLFRTGMQPQVAFKLYNGTTLIGTRNSQIAYSGTNNANVVATLTDDLSRTYRIDLHADPVIPCPNTVNLVDYTFWVPVQVTSPAGVVTTISYPGSGSIVGLDPYRNRPVGTVSRGGNTWTYGATGNALGVWSRSATSPTGSVSSVGTADVEDGYYYGAEGCNLERHLAAQIATSQTDGLSHTTTFDYDADLSITSATKPESNGFSYEFDARKNIVKITAVAKSGSGLVSEIVYQAGYDTTCSNALTCNKPNWTKDGRGNQTDYTYDSTHGGVLTETRPADANGVRPQTRYTYTGYNTGLGTIYRVTGISACISGSSCIGTANEQRTALAYWGSTFLPLARTDSSGDGSLTATTTFDYDSAGRKIMEQNPRGFSTYFRYDAVGRLIGKVSPPDSTNHHLAQRFSYNADDQQTLVEFGSVTALSDTAWASFSVDRQVATTYDSAGRKVSEATSAGGAVYTITQFSYDADDRLECAAVRMNPATYGALPSSACSLATTGAYGPDRITKLVYDAAGQVLKEQKAYGTSLQQDYAIYTYSNNGKQTSVTDANGNKASMTYDGHDRQTRWNFPSATTPGTVSSTDYEEYAYDANGNRTSLRKRDGRTFGYSFDNLNRVSVKTVPDACVSGYACTNVAASATRDVYYSYDLRGLQTSARFDSMSGSDAVTSAYDGFGRLTSSTTSMGGVSRTLSYGYDANGNRIRLTHPDGNFTYTYYDGLDRLFYDSMNVSTPTLQKYYDAQGRMWAIDRWSAATSSWAASTYYGFDGLSRLASIEDRFVSSSYNVIATFAYNPASQITTKTRNNDAYTFTGYTSVSRSYTANGLNQYATVGANSYGYDSNGNLTSDGIIAYTYDAENRLVVTSAGANLTYDPLGRLYETYSAATGATRFLYDGDQLTAEYDGSGNLLRRYVHSDGDDDPLVWYEGSGVSSPRYLYSDHQGSIVAITDASGNGTRNNAYDDYGIPTAGNSVSVAGRFQYTGQAWIPELGMYHYKARIYSPRLGRFMQTDPIGYDDQVNLYTYVGNDPINGRDPTGMCEGVWNCLMGGTVRNKDGTVTVESSIILRVLVPGQIAWDDARTSWANGDRVGAAIHTVRMAGEIGLTVATVGGGRVAAIPQAAARTASVSGGKTLLGETTKYLAARGFDGPRVGQIMGWGSKLSGASRRLATMDGAAAAAQVREAGMGKNMVRSLMDGYRDAAARGRGGDVAPVRVRILEKILMNW